jgi:hypothetical protein
VGICSGACECTLQAITVAQLVGCHGGGRPANQRVQLKDVRQREIDRLELTGLILSHDAALSLWTIGVVAGKDLKSLAVLCHQTPSDVADAVADLLGGHDP